MNISGYISRANLSPAQANLPIQVDPYWILLGDTGAAADMSIENGLAPAVSVLKTVWANSPYVRGQQLMLATPDLTSLDLRLIVEGTSMADAQTQASAIIEAITQQLTYTVSLTFDDATYAWTCFAGDYVVAFNQLQFFGYLLPIYLSLPRDPTPVSGPV